LTTINDVIGVPSTTGNGLLCERQLSSQNVTLHPSFNGAGQTVSAASALIWPFFLSQAAAGETTFSFYVHLRYIYLDMEETAAVNVDFPVLLVFLIVSVAQSSNNVFCSCSVLAVEDKTLLKDVFIH
jgi:hypothetical protein